MFALDPSAKNVMPARYRQVALSASLESLDAQWLQHHFAGLEAYMRTRFIVARKGEQTALVEVDRPPSTDLFSAIEQARVLAPPSLCRYVVSPDTDVGVASQLAAIAANHPDKSCIVVEGRYSHVSFLLNPDPMKLYVFDIVPPFPSKLLDQVERVLAVAEDLPPVVVHPVMIDSRKRLAGERETMPGTVLVPCRGSGISLEGVDIAYLDERPAAADWTLLGCERSHQIHHWFYGVSPDTVDICPKNLLGNVDGEGGRLPALARCCLLQEGRQETPQATFVPWGATLVEVRQAIEAILERRGVEWTPT